MEIEFQMLNEKTIKIIGVLISADGKISERHEIGEIKTPSGSGQTNLNCIQICGFTEAFDLWGCGTYQRPSHGNDVVMTEHIEQMRDIQLKFDWESVRGDFKYDKECCHKCFNKPCTCEVKVKYENPFTVKCERDLYIYKVKKDDKVLIGEVKNDR
jgi:hypothetical protein